MPTKYYAERDAIDLDRAGGFYSRHVAAMTDERLESKSDIAAELGFRDMEIQELRRIITKLTTSRPIDEAVELLDNHPVLAPESPNEFVEALKSQAHALASGPVGPVPAPTAKALAAPNCLDQHLGEVDVVGGEVEGSTELVEQIANVVDAPNGAWDVSVSLRRVGSEKPVQIHDPVEQQLGEVCPGLDSPPSPRRKEIRTYVGEVTVADGEVKGTSEIEEALEDAGITDGVWNVHIVAILAAAAGEES